jgi:alkanesulfonate monooxygenase SsuD/methylene tetrahydromethanopterin reductase-like flavin-dependent oxidoreductase (luciferase family)
MTQLRFGVFLTPDAGRRDDVIAQTLAAEAAGLDLVGIQDHPYQRRFLDTWVLIGHLLARTSRTGYSRPSRTSRCGRRR